HCVPPFRFDYGQGSTPLASFYHVRSLGASNILYFNGDFDGDGYDDLLARNRSTGELSIQKLRGTGNRVIAGENIGTVWSLTDDYGVTRGFELISLDATPVDIDTDDVSEICLTLVTKHVEAIGPLPETTIYIQRGYLESENDFSFDYTAFLQDGSPVWTGMKPL